MKPGSPPTPIETRFNKFVRKTATCWLWTGCRNKGGYGTIYGYGRPHIASRVAWENYNGEKVKKGFEVCHHCDNPPCVRPSHLFLGTRSDNLNDAVSKGLRVGLRGENHPSAKLTFAMADEIRKSFKPHVMTYAMLAKRYSVKPRTIKTVLEYRSYIR